MNVTALAQLVAESGKSNDRISVRELKNRLLMAGFDEFADALLALYDGPKANDERPDHPNHPWF